MNIKNMEGKSTHKVNLEGLGDSILNLMFENNLIDMKPLFDSDGNVEGGSLMISASTAEQIEKLIEDEVFVF